MVGRSVAQPGSALASGARGREFESPRSDHFLSSRALFEALKALRRAPDGAAQADAFGYVRLRAKSRLLLTRAVRSAQSASARISGCRFRLPCGEPAGSDGKAARIRRRPSMHPAAMALSLPTPLRGAGRKRRQNSSHPSSSSHAPSRDGVVASAPCGRGEHIGLRRRAGSRGLEALNPRSRTMT